MRVLLPVRIHCHATLSPPISSMQTRWRALQLCSKAVRTRDSAPSNQKWDVLNEHSHVVTSIDMMLSRALGCLHPPQSPVARSGNGVRLGRCERGWPSHSDHAARGPRRYVPDPSPTEQAAVLCVSVVRRVLGSGAVSARRACSLGPLGAVPPQSKPVHSSSQRFIFIIQPETI
jgi:hypothetical protein